ncbi:hypothetical protein ACQF4O_15840, partial [Klebsiella pneumoniae]
MIATGVDIESTGIDFLSGHKIIEIAMVKYEIETQAMVDSFVMRFNPRRSIDPKEGANKQVISSQADSLIKISRIWA